MSNTILNKSGENRHSYLILDKGESIQSLAIEYAVSYGVFEEELY